MSWTLPARYSQLLSKSSDLGLRVSQLHRQVLLGPGLLLQGGRVAGRLRAGGATEQTNHTFLFLCELCYSLQKGRHRGACNRLQMTRLPSIPISSQHLRTRSVACWLKWFHCDDQVCLQWFRIWYTHFVAVHFIAKVQLHVQNVFGFTRRFR